MADEIRVENVLNGLDQIEMWVRGIRDVIAGMPPNQVLWDSGMATSSGVRKPPPLGPDCGPKRSTRPTKPEPLA
jgi:hypothetical protein